jgi:hypothetical protein
MLIIQDRCFFAKINDVFIFIIPAIEQGKLLNDFRFLFLYGWIGIHYRDKVLMAFFNPSIRISISSIVLYMAKEALVVPGMQ